MNVRENLLKKRLKAGGTALLTFIRMPEPTLAEIMGYAGLDGVIIDTEHGSIGWTEAERMILAAYAAGTTPILRVPSHDPADVTRALDIGAMGVLAPHIRTESEARSLMDSAYYPPKGHRGIAMSRPAAWGAVAAADYFTQINGEILVGAMIEDQECAGQLEAIAGVGLDFMFLGAADMSGSIGKPGAFTDPFVVEMGRRVVEACASHGVAAGYPGRSRDTALEALHRGFRFVTVGTAESLLLQHTRDLVTALREAMKK